MESAGSSSSSKGRELRKRPSIQGTLITNVVNDPRDSKGWWGLGRSGDLAGLTAWNAPPPPLDPQKYPHYTRRDLGKYLRIVQTAHQEFVRERESLAETATRQLLLGDVGPEGDQQQQAAALRAVAAQGDGLAKALQRVPVQFFQEDFSIERSGILDSSSPGGDGDDGLDELMERIDTLTQYLDVVETQMAREVALRSRAVSAASSQVGVLHQELCGALGNVRRLRRDLDQADAFTFASTCHVKALQQRHWNVDATLEALQALEEVHSSRAALQLLLDGQDYAGALDLLEVVAHNMEATVAQGITTFAPALPEMRDTRELLESLLACEFVGLANFDGATVVLETAIARICAMGPGVTPTPADLAALIHGAPAPEGPDQESMENGLYAASGYSAHSHANGEAVMGADEAAAVAREQLHDKLLPVVLALLRVDRLSGAMHQLRENVSNATKGLIAEALERCLGPTGPHYLQQPAGGAAQGLLQDSASGGHDSHHTAPAAGPGPGEGQPAGSAAVPGASRDTATGATSTGGHATGPGAQSSALDTALALTLQGVGHDGFMQVLLVVHGVVAAFVKHTTQLAAIIRQDILPAARVPAPTAAAVARDTAAVAQGLAEVAQARWVRLLSARSSVTARLKLYEFQGLSDACEAFAQLLEPLSVRAAMGVRNAMQSQGRAFLDALHARNVAQLQHLLEAEQWTMAEVAPQFQAIVDRVLARSSPPHIQAGGHSRNMSMSDAWHAQTTASSNGGSTWGGEGGVRGGSMGGEHDHATRMHPGKALSWGGASPHTQTGSAATSSLSAGMLHVHGKAFPLVNTTLMLLKLLDEYMVLVDGSPMYVMEVGHYVCDLIKGFNAQVCQLVLGAGAVRTAGLKSISAKHLALSCESCYMLARLLPSLRAALLGPGGAAGLGGGAAQLAGPSAEPRKRMLHLEFDKVAQDLSSHTSEIHSKLVDIMQDRLVAAARQLTQDASKWPTSPTTSPNTSSSGAVGQPPPSAFVPSAALTSLHKQLTTLHNVLSPLLQQEEVQYIFGRVASLYSEALAATFDSLQHPKLVLPPAPTPPASTQYNNPLARGLVRGASQLSAAAASLSVQVVVKPEELAVWEESRRRNAQYALQCLQQLPLDPAHASTYLSRMSTFLTKHYGVAGMQPSCVVQPGTSQQSSSQPQLGSMQQQVLATAPAGNGDVERRRSTEQQPQLQQLNSSGESAAMLDSSGKLTAQSSAGQQPPKTARLAARASLDMVPSSGRASLDQTQHSNRSSVDLHARPAATTDTGFHIEPTQAQPVLDSQLTQAYQDAVLGPHPTLRSSTPGGEQDALLAGVVGTIAASNGASSAGSSLGGGAAVTLQTAEPHLSAESPALANETSGGIRQEGGVVEGEASSEQVSTGGVVASQLQPQFAPQEDSHQDQATGMGSHMMHDSSLGAFVVKQGIDSPTPRDSDTGAAAVEQVGAGAAGTEPVAVEQALGVGSGWEGSEDLDQGHALDVVAVQAAVPVVQDGAQAAVSGVQVSSDAGPAHAGAGASESSPLPKQEVQFLKADAPGWEGEGGGGKGGEGWEGGGDDNDVTAIEGLEVMSEHSSDDEGQAVGTAAHPVIPHKEGTPIVGNPTAQRPQHGGNAALSSVSTGTEGALGDGQEADMGLSPVVQVSSQDQLTPLPVANGNPSNGIVASDSAMLAGTQLVGDKAVVGVIGSEHLQHVVTEADGQQHEDEDDSAYHPLA